MASDGHRVVPNWVSDGRPEVLAFIEERKTMTPGLRARTAATAPRNFLRSPPRAHRATSQHPRISSPRWGDPRRIPVAAEEGSGRQSTVGPPR